MRTPNYTKIPMQVHYEIYQGQSIERMVEKAEASNQPIENESPIIYTPRKDGVKPQHNIRADKWEEAQAAMGVVSKSYADKRAEWLKSLEAPAKPKTDTTTQSEA